MLERPEITISAVARRVAVRFAAPPCPCFEPWKLQHQGLVCCAATAYRVSSTTELAFFDTRLLVFLFALSWVILVEVLSVTLVKVSEARWRMEERKVRRGHNSEHDGLVSAVAGCCVHSKKLRCHRIPLNQTPMTESMRDRLV